jgi:hypothetical protein
MEAHDGQKCSLCMVGLDHLTLLFLSCSLGCSGKISESLWQEQVQSFESQKPCPKRFVGHWQCPDFVIFFRGDSRTPIYGASIG